MKRFLGFLGFCILILLLCYIAFIKKPPKPLDNASAFLYIPTYDGSNQCAHPSVQYFPDGWNGHKYWMVMTPATSYSSAMENPCVYVSEDKVNWSVPAGLTNPLSSKPYPGHNCDPEIFYNSSTDELWVYYVETNDTTRSLVKLMKSSNGVHWSYPETVITDSRARYSTVSPTVEFSPSLNKYYMWTVNSAYDGSCNQENLVERRESSDGITWSSPEAAASFIQQNSQIWHIFIRYIPSKNEYWAIYAAYQNGFDASCTLLYFARSTDGLNWTTYLKPALARGKSSSWDDYQIYRSTFVYDPQSDILNVWYSAVRSSGYVWKIGYTQNTYTKFLGRLTK